MRRRISEEQGSKMPEKKSKEPFFLSPFFFREEIVLRKIIQLKLKEAKNEAIEKERKKERERESVCVCVIT